MKRIMIVMFMSLVAVALAACTGGAGLMKLQSQETMNSSAASETLADDIKLYFAGQSHAAVRQNLGELKTSRRTNGVSKSPVEACRWVMLSALKSLQDGARQRGANAVVNIRSNWRNQPLDDGSMYECEDGNLMSGVALIGEAVKL